MARHAVIIAGGTGTRLWPLSRRARPKPLLPLIDGRSLLQVAAQRLAAIVPASRGLVCADQAHRAAVRQALPNLADDQFLGEPMPRDSVNAVGLTAAVLTRRDPQAVFAVLTADHLIEPEHELVRGMELGFRLVEADATRMVTFMIRPTHAATGYGYIEPGKTIDDFDGAVRVRRFVEKPDADAAESMIKAGAGWNSGMFIFHAAMFMQALAWHAPRSHEGLSRVAAAWDGSRRGAVLDEVYPALPKVSLDHAVMESASQDSRITICAVPLEVRWIDVGSWSGLAQALQPDEQGHRAAGVNVVHLDSRNVLAASDDAGHTIATIGCQNLTIVHTKDVTLVCPADQAQRVKELVARLPGSLQ